MASPPPAATTDAAVAVVAAATAVLRARILTCARSSARRAAAAAAARCRALWAAAKVAAPRRSTLRRRWRAEATWPTQRRSNAARSSPRRPLARYTSLSVDVARSTARAGNDVVLSLAAAAATAVAVAVAVAICRLLLLLLCSVDRCGFSGTGAISFFAWPSVTLVAPAAAAGRGVEDDSSSGIGAGGTAVSLEAMRQSKSAARRVALRNPSRPL